MFEIDSFNQILSRDVDILESLDDLYSSTEAIQTHQIIEQNIPKHLYPFGLTGGGNDFCISMGKEDYGYIYILFRW